MDDFEVLPAPTPAIVEGSQPDQITDGTGAPEQVAETPEQIAEKSANERKEKARANRESYVRRLERDRDRAMDLAADLARQRSQVAPQAVTPPSDSKPPRREDFQTWEDYEDARVDYRFEQRAQKDAAKQGEEFTQLLTKAQQEHQEQQLQGAHMQRVADFARTVPDFEDVTDREDVVIPRAAADAIRHMPNSPLLLYAIGKEPELAERLQRMNPTQQAAFVGQISAVLSQRPANVSKAPAPGTPVGRGGSPETSLSGSTQDQYYASITKHHKRGR